MTDFFKNFFRRNGELTLEELIAKKTTISFVVFFGCFALAYAGWQWLSRQPKGNTNIQAPLRKVLDANEYVFSRVASYRHFAKTFPKNKAAGFVRVNGNVGLKSELDSANWKLHLVKANGDTLLITLDEIKKIPRTEIIFDFKCIEGWSQISHWGGVSFHDFVRHFHLEQEAAFKYVGMSTPDEEYYVGIDMPSAMHPQTLVCYEVNNKPLPMNQGFPLRMIVPVKYGIKSLKRIGYMYFSNERPKDYWFERGYDYYSGL
jgi:DMSO/TMAO reductase YedYZ molybdopterin-dependent catalytic subunit